MRSSLVLACFLVLGIAPPAAAATRTWTGTADGTWTNPANWGGTAPNGGDDLVFPAGALNESNTNNFPATTLFTSITFSGDAYTLNGNAITLGPGGIQTTGGTSHTVLLPLTLGISQTWHLGTGTATTLGPIELSAQTLTIADSNNATIAGPISGIGSLNLNNSFVELTGVNTTHAPVTLNLSEFGIEKTYLGPITGAPAAVGVAAGATTGNINIGGPFGEFVPGFGTPAGVSNSGSISLGNFILWEEFVTDATHYAAVNVTGTITLNGTVLELFSPPALPAGTVLTIAANDGSEPVVGTFIGLPEGGNITAAGATPQNFTISYHGGTGNDITLTAGAAATIPTTTTLTAVPPTPQIGQSVQLTATVTGPPTPTGTVTFIDLQGLGLPGLTELGTVPLNPSGVATITTTLSLSGQDVIIALYNGGGSFESSSDSLPFLFPATIPTLSDYTLALLAIVLALSGAIAIRPR